MKEVTQTNKMAVMPMKKLLMNMGLPIILSMMMQALYNIVDSVFVANMAENGEAALNALTLAFPVQMLMVAIGIGTGVGMNALLSKNMGMGDLKKASKAAGNAFFLGIVIFIVFALFGITLSRVYVASQTSNPLILEMAVRYLRINCIISFGLVFFNISEKMLQATGRSNLSTIAQIVGAVTNIVLDPILIYGWLGLPQMGIDGAALATVIGQIAAAVLGLFFHFKYDKEIENRLAYLKPDKTIIKEIYTIGLPAIIAQAVMSVMTYGLNLILGSISENAVTAYGIYYKVQQFLLFAAFGLRDAITPVISFNYGMGDKRRIQEGIRYGMLYTLAIMGLGIVVLEVFAAPFATLFGLSGQTEAMCVSAMRIVSISLIFAGANVAYQGIFQALNGGLQSLIISLCRQLILILPLAWGLSVLIGKNPDRIAVVWIAFLVAEGISTLIAALFMKGIRKQTIEVLS